MRDLPTKTKMNAWESLALNYLQKQFQRLYCDWMTSRSTSRLAGSDLDQAGNTSKVSTYRIIPNMNSYSEEINLSEQFHTYTKPLRTILDDKYKKEDLNKVMKSMPIKRIT